ncbi:transglycosylase SLT domain-containing protein [Rhizobium ruizarguesonis]
MIRTFIAALAVATCLTGCTGVAITNGTLGVKFAPDDSGHLQPSISLDLKMEDREPVDHKPSVSGNSQRDTESVRSSAPSHIRASTTSGFLSPSQREMLDLTMQVAERRDIDKADFAALVWIESRFNANAKNPNSSASGLCQFTAATAAQYKLTAPFDARKNLEACAVLWNDNSAFFETKVGHKPSASDLYLMHQQGAGTAVNLALGGNRLAKSVASRDSIALNLPGGNPDTVSADEFLLVWKAQFEKSRRLFTSR